MQYDVVVVGAGPAGLAMATQLQGIGLRIAIVERQSCEALADPADDGREIALTHASRALMQRLGIWERLRDDQIGTLRDALVLDGDDRDGLLFSHRESGQSQLGWLVSNHAIRRASWDAMQAAGGVDMFPGCSVSGVQIDDDGVRLALSDQRRLQGKLVIAADSRFSDTRRALGIGASLHDFGRTMLVVRMYHTLPHHSVAWEWFRYGQTLAMLPLHDPNTCSAVITDSAQAIAALQALDAGAFSAEVTRRFDGRLGEMTRASDAYAYPLVGVYAHRFFAQRGALIGDAAVGMHPVTAHGYNYGLLSVDALGQRILDAHAAGRPFWSPPLLRDYDAAHRAATRPLYLTTRMLAHLYTDDRGGPRIARKLALRTGRMLPPFRRGVIAGLTQVTTGRSPILQVGEWVMRHRPQIR